QQWIVSCDEHIGVSRALIARIDDLGIELHRQIKRGLPEGSITLGKHREQECAQEKHTDGNCGNTVVAEAAFGSVAAFQSDIATCRLCRGATGFEGHIGHYSYCSRYLRTMWSAKMFMIS